MFKSVSQFTAIALLSAALAGLPPVASAQTTNTNATPKKAVHGQKEPLPRTKAGHPFTGKVAAVDQTAKTFKVGESTYQVTSQTKIMKAGKPATLEDAMVGEEVVGFARASADGKMHAVMVRFGPRPTPPTPEKKKDTAPK